MSFHDYYSFICWLDDEKGMYLVALDDSSSVDRQEISKLIVEYLERKETTND